MIVKVNPNVLNFGKFEGKLQHNGIFSIVQYMRERPPDGFLGRSVYARVMSAVSA